MPNQDNEQEFEDFMGFLHQLVQAQEQEQEEETQGLLLQTPHGDFVVEADGPEISVSINGFTVVSLAYDQYKALVDINAYNYLKKHHSSEYRQRIEFETKHNNSSQLQQALQQLQVSENIAVLDVATNDHKEAYILAKSLDNTFGKHSFQIWHVPIDGVACCVETASTLNSGQYMFNDACNMLD